MSDFDLYPGQNCRCGNDPMCWNCGSGRAYEEQCQREEEERQYQQELDALVALAPTMAKVLLCWFGPCPDPEDQCTPRDHDAQWPQTCAAHYANRERLADLVERLRAIKGAQA